MATALIPSELLCICKRIVGEHHRKYGFGNLAADVDADHNIRKISKIPEASAVYNSAVLSFKFRKWWFLAGIGAVTLAVLVPWWSLAAVVLIFLVDRILLYREKAARRFLSAILLSLEILANDFLGWGKAYPEERNKASEIIGENRESEWLDYYLPNRNELDPAFLKTIAPPSSK